MKHIVLRDGEAAEPLGGGALYILQNRALPCFSLDACLLAAFCPLREGMRAADLCSGTGVIPLLLQLRLPGIEVNALELMPQMAQMAARSFALNGLDNLRMTEGDARRAAELIGRDYDMVSCNPPYYPLASSRVSRDACRAAARSEIHGTLAEMLAAAAAILKEGGRLALSMRAGRQAEAEALLKRNGLAPVRLMRVRDRDEAAPWLVLTEAEKTREPRECRSETLTVYDAARRYTPQMRRFCHAWLGGD